MNSNFLLIWGKTNPDFPNKDVVILEDVDGGDTKDVTRDVVEEVDGYASENVAGDVHPSVFFSSPFLFSLVI